MPEINERRRVAIILAISVVARSSPEAAPSRLRSPPSGIEGGDLIAIYHETQWAGRHLPFVA